MSSIIAARSSDDTTLINPGDPEYLNSGVAGINWKTKLLPVKIGSPAEFIADVPPPQWDAMLKALEYVVIKKNQGLNIIAVNMSLSFDEQGDLTSPVPDVFAQKFWDLRYIHGILPIGGAGNSRIIYENGEPDGVRGYPVYPCRDPSVFCASCVGYHHQIVSYAQYGDEVDGDYDYENVDLCAFGADTGSCGINYDPYGSGTCSDTPFGDIRFPGMMVASSETTHRPGWSVCGTVDSECSPGSFCDQGVYGVAPGDTTTLGDLKHVWGPSAFMTSGTTAQLSGLAGLVAAAFPEFGPDEIEAKIIAAADNIDAANPGITPGDLGAGVTNAWKAVTRWGETPASDLWSGEVWISGDITIPVGAQLIIAAGTTVHIAADDVTAAGSDHTRTEIIVDGTLTCLGTALNPITFDVIADTLTDEWGPIRLRGTGENPVVQLEHCQFQNMSSLMVIDNSAGESTVTISDCTAATSSHGVTLSPLGVNHNLTIQALELTCTTPGTATGIRVLPQAQTNPMVTIGNGTVVDGYFVGMDIDTGDQTTIGDVAINNSLNTGVQLASTGSSLNITGPIEINDTQNTGSIFQGDISSVGNLTVNGTGAVGIFHNTDIATHYQNIELNNCGLWAFYALSPVAGTLVESTVIDSCAVDGLRAAGGGITLGDGVVISNSTQHAVYLDNVNTVIHDVAITNANGAIDIVNGAHAVISDSLIEYCYTAVSALATGTATLSQGGTHFNSITRYYISNFNTTYTINAMSNCYDSSATPSVRKFTGSGPITYLPGYCE
jgi:hypothetical protein